MSLKRPAALTAIAGLFLLMAALPAHAQVPFTGSCTATGVPSPVSTPACTIAVPADKRLIVHRVSAQMYFNPGKLAQLAIDYVTKGTSGRQLYNPVDSGVFFGGLQVSTVSSEAFIAADAGTTLTLYFFAQNGSSVPFGGEAFAWVTGTLVSREHDHDD